jgi:hypothetical protein
MLQAVVRFGRRTGNDRSLGRSDGGDRAADVAGARLAAHRGVDLAWGWGHPKVVQRVLGHASAAMTMDLYGHMIDDNLWSAAKKLGTARGHNRVPCSSSGAVIRTAQAADLRVWVEPPVGIEPATCSLRAAVKRRPGTPGVRSQA